MSTLDATKKQITSFSKNLTKMIQEFEEKTGLKVRWLDIIREHDDKGPEEMLSPVNDSTTVRKVKKVKVSLDLDILYND